MVAHSLKMRACIPSGPGEVVGRIFISFFEMFSDKNFVRVSSGSVQGGKSGIIEASSCVNTLEKKLFKTSVFSSIDVVVVLSSFVRWPILDFGFASYIYDQKALGLSLTSSARFCSD